jgi:hypothetical protein
MDPWLTTFAASHRFPMALHQAGVADNVGGQDRRQFALLTGHGTLPVFLQWMVEEFERLDNQS